MGGLFLCTWRVWLFFPLCWIPRSTSAETLPEIIFWDISLKQTKKKQVEKSTSLSVFLQLENTIGAFLMEQRRLGFMKTVQKCSQPHPAKSSIISTSLCKPSPAVARFLPSGGNSDWGTCSFCLLLWVDLLALLSHPFTVFSPGHEVLHGCSRFGCCESETFGNESLELRMGQVSQNRPGRSPGFAQA